MDNIQLEGAFDSIEGADVLGCMIMPNAPDVKLTVSVAINGQAVCLGTADQYRPDLKEAGFGDGKYGFDIPIPILRVMTHGDYKVQVVAMLDAKPVGVFPAKTLSVNETTLAAIIKSTIDNQNYKMAQGKPVDLCIARISELLLLDPDSTLAHDWINEEKSKQGGAISMQRSDAFRASWEVLANYQNVLAQVETSLNHLHSQTS